MKLIPEQIVDKFFRSASGGKILPVRLRRILTIVVVPVWVGGVILIAISFYQGFNAIPKYQALQRFKISGYDRDNDDQNCYGGHVHENWRSDGESLHQCGCFDSQFWRNMGINNPDHMDSVSSLLAIAESRQIGSLLLFFNLLYVFLLLYLLPWVIIRLVYWIVNVENKEEDIRV